MRFTKEMQVFADFLRNVYLASQGGPTNYKWDDLSLSVQTSWLAVAQSSVSYIEQQQKDALVVAVPINTMIDLSSLKPGQLIRVVDAPTEEFKIRQAREVLQNLANMFDRTEPQVTSLGTIKAHIEQVLSLLK